MVIHISSGSPFEAKIGYSRALVDGNMVYVSGTTGYDYATMTMPEDAGAQARNPLRTTATSRPSGWSLSLISTGVSCRRRRCGR